MFPKWGWGYAKLFEYGTVKQTAGAWRFSMYQRFVWLSLSQQWHTACELVDLFLRATDSKTEVLQSAF